LEIERSEKKDQYSEFVFSDKASNTHVHLSMLQLSLYTSVIEDVIKKSIITMEIVNIQLCISDAVLRLESSFVRSFYLFMSLIDYVKNVNNECDNKN
ncbi:hypothetical protein T08_6615, partial [Trichinella sp. T8]